MDLYSLFLNILAALFALFSFAKEFRRWRNSKKLSAQNKHYLSDPRTGKIHTSSNREVQ